MEGRNTGRVALEESRDKVRKWVPKLPETGINHRVKKGGVRNDGGLD